MNKKSFIKVLLLTVFLTVITACTSDIDDDTNTTADIVDNTIVSPINRVTVNENTINVITLVSNTDTTLTLSGSDASKFKISGSSLIFQTAPDYETDKEKYYITLTQTQSDGIKKEQDFIITIIDTNDNFPIFKNENNISIKENRTAVLELDVNDEDYNSTLEYSIKEDAFDSSLFEIDDNEIVFKDAPDYEKRTLYTVTAIADDGNNTTQQLITVNIIDVADIIPVLSNFQKIISEDVENNTTIGNIKIIEVGDTNISNMLLSGDGNESFIISLDGNVSVALDAKLDYDNGIKRYNLELIATNEAGESNSTDVNITLTNVIDEVAILNDINVSIKENASSRDIVGQISKVYEGDSYISEIKLLGDSNEIFDVDPSGYISLAKENVLDYETIKNYYFTAIATNEAGDSQGVDINISIEDYINNPFQTA
ncbi:MAG: hypothetical protein U9P38_00365, partial [Campylobacterota bacterium]|nr:hypothetical protein [Campylobacterota bacterium]